MMTRKRAALAKPSTLQGDSTEAKLLKLTKKVNALAPELKTLQAAGSATNVDDAAGAISYITGIAQGSDVINRVGDKICLKEINIKAKITAGFTTGTQTLYGLYLVKDLQSNGVVPTVSGTAQSIFVNPGPVQAFVNVSTKDRFKIVRQFVFGGVPLAAGNQTDYVQFKVKCNHVMSYHDTTSAQTGSGKNAYYLVFLTDDATDTVDWAFFTELRFTDV